MIFRPIFTTVAASRDMNARTLEWESTGANVQRLRPLPRSLDLGSGNSLVIMLSPIEPAIHFKFAQLATLV